MPDKKLTDKEIVKALEYWKKFDEEIDQMLSGRFKDDKMLLEQKEIVKITLNLFDLINRLQAENEDIKFLYENLKEEHLEIIKAIKHTKAEAYKEFAEELWREIIDDIHFSQIEKDYFGVMINNLLKELVGEDK